MTPISQMIRMKASTLNDAEEIYRLLAIAEYEESLEDEEPKQWWSEEE